MPKFNPQLKERNAKKRKDKTVFEKREKKFFLT